MGCAAGISSANWVDGLLLAPVEKLEVLFLEVFNGLVLRIAYDDAHDYQVAGDFKVVRGLIGG